MTRTGAFKVLYSSLGQIRAEAISAIEGQILSEEQRSRFREWDAASLSAEQQRAEIMRLYLKGAALK
jgi:hypothetical protein